MDQPDLFMYAIPGSCRVSGIKIADYSRSLLRLEGLF
jgi:hypothetical protein